MGYYVSIDILVTVAPEKVAGAVRALTEVSSAARWVSVPEGGWPETPEGLVAAFYAWDFSATPMEGGGVGISHFEGEKWFAAYEGMFNALAGFATSGNVIECSGEGHEYWAYSYTEDAVVQETGEVVYGRDTEIEVLKAENTALRGQLAELRALNRHVKRLEM